MPTLELLTTAPDAEPVELADAPAHDGPIALLHAPGDAPFLNLHAAAQRAATVLITFPVFRDGRGFTLAARLRERGYRGRIEADGHLLPDQARNLARCGFDAVRLPEGAVVEDWERMLAAFSAAYQPAEDGLTPVWALRTKAS